MTTNEYIMKKAFKKLSLEKKMISKLNDGAANQVHGGVNPFLKLTKKCDDPTAMTFCYHCPDHGTVDNPIQTVQDL